MPVKEEHHDFNYPRKHWQEVDMLNILNDDFPSFLHWLVDEFFIEEIKELIYVVEKPWKYEHEYKLFLNKENA